MQFLLEYMKHPSKIGAVAPSSRYLARKMVESVCFQECGCIVEYGPGTGVFTEQIVLRKKEDTVLLVIEQNEQFYEILKERYANKQNVYVIHGDAADILHYLHSRGIPQADYIISGLPFTSLPPQVSKKIFHATKKAMGEGGRFITFQYTLLKKQLFQYWFNIEHMSFELKNLPPAYVFTMTNRC